MIPAERVVPVTPLATEADGDAVELFVTRARAARPEFALDATTTSTVVELCRRLDGIPLAIELAAARTRSIAPTKILERLDERFRMLTGGSRTAVARHQTLQAAVDWSYELLSDAERAVLDRLSVFAGGFTLDAAETVASDDDDRRVRRAGARERAGRQVAGRRRSGRGDVPVVGDDPPVRGRPVGRVGNRRAGARPSRRLLPVGGRGARAASSPGRATSPPWSGSPPTSRTCA